MTRIYMRCWKCFCKIKEAKEGRLADGLHRCVKCHEERKAEND
jgi:hypothetical protein